MKFSALYTTNTLKFAFLKTLIFGQKFRLAAALIFPSNVAAIQAQTGIRRRLATPGKVRSDLPASIVYSAALTVLT